MATPLVRWSAGSKEIPALAATHPADSSSTIGWHTLQAIRFSPSGQILSLLFRSNIFLEGNPAVPTVFSFVVRNTPPLSCIILAGGRNKTTAQTRENICASCPPTILRENITKNICHIKSVGVASDSFWFLWDELASLWLCKSSSNCGKRSRSSTTFGWTSLNELAVQYGLSPLIVVGSRLALWPQSFWSHSLPITQVQIEGL